MSEAAILLLENSIEVSAGRAEPIGTARDYHVAAAEFAASRARHDETATEALAWLIVSGSSIVCLLYGAADKSRVTA